MTPNVSRKDVERIVAREFPPESRSYVLSLLDSIQYAEPKTVARAQLAAVKLCDRNISYLRRHVDTAKRDFRDVVAGAEYPRQLALGIRGVTLKRESPAEYEELERADFEDYMRWLGQEHES